MYSISKSWGEICALMLIVSLCTCIGSIVITKLSQTILFSIDKVFLHIKATISVSTAFTNIGTCGQAFKAVQK